jgi:hypothetical protein
MHFSMIAIVLLLNVEPTTSPYKGEETRAIKSLAPEQIDQLLSGRGMGLAKAAELNSYPGPMHVLTLKQELGLSPEQISKVQIVFEAMKKNAIALGKQIVDAEAALDAAFAKRAIDADQLKTRLRNLGELQADLRDAHLVAHLQTRQILSDRQVAKYDELRGYGAKPAEIK